MFEKKDRNEIEEPLFEDKIELIWDKGDASGLVYYTDAAYWDAKQGDFDERTVDDWDVEPVEPQTLLKRRRAPFVPHALKFLGRTQGDPKFRITQSSSGRFDVDGDRPALDCDSDQNGFERFTVTGFAGIF